MRRVLTVALVAAAIGGLYQVTVAANGGSMGGSSAPMTPEAMAKDAYNSGIDHKDKGRKLEAQAESQPVKDRDKTEAKAKDEYAKALKDFKKAADLVPNLYQAYNGMGFAYRKTGEPAKALEMYDKALDMAPGFPDAMEYRGEAYLALNRVEDAKQSYLALFAKDRAQADDLMKAMTGWIVKRQADPAGVDPAVISGLDGWIKDRMKVALITADMGVSSHLSIWK